MRQQNQVKSRHSLCRLRNKSKLPHKHGAQNPCHFFRRLGSGLFQPGLYDTDTTGNDEGTELFIISIGLRTFQKTESALFDLVLQAVNEGEVSMGTDHDSGEISVAV